MKNSLRFLIFTFLISVFSVAVLAQDDGDDPVSVFEVRLPITVESKKKKKGRRQLIKGLTRDDFIVYEDGVQQETTFFTDEKTTPPIYVGVLMDTSASTKGKLGFSKEAAGNFLHTVIKLRKDKAAFMTFDHNIKLHQDFTDDLSDLTDAVEGVKKTGSQTALYDAIWQFSDEKLRNAPGRRVVVVITDGDNNFSRAELDDVIDIAQRTETTIFAISTKEGFLGSVPGVEAGTIKDKGDKKLEKLCEETGGKAFFSGDMLALERSFTAISKELHSQYIVTYRPANQNYDGNKHKRKIEIKFKNKAHAKKYRIRTKTEYRAIKDSL